MSFKGYRLMLGFTEAEACDYVSSRGGAVIMTRGGFGSRVHHFELDGYRLVRIGEENAVSLGHYEVARDGGIIRGRHPIGRTLEALALSRARL